jgi:predicted N-acetyltransferase YhbS
MTGLAIREAIASDEAAVGELLVQAFAVQYARMTPAIVMHPERAADLRSQAEKRRRSTVLVAEIDGRLVGTVALYRAGATGSEAWIAGAANLRLLAIDAVHQGRGLSGALLDEAETMAAHWGASAICLHVRRGVHGVARLYQARGYLRNPAGDLDHLPQVFLEAYALKLPPLPAAADNRIAPAR